MKKVLIIRFSSFGDIIQTISAARVLKLNFPQVEITWITRSDFASFLQAEPTVDKIIEFKREDGLLKLITLSKELSKENYDLVYDAHNNLRSKVMKAIFKFFGNSPIITRSKNRIKRILFFKLRINLYKNWPFKGALSFIEPLKKLNISNKKLLENNLEWSFPKKLQTKINSLIAEHHDFITLVPSAAWPTKRWPLEYFQELINLMPHKKFVIIAGPTDYFTKEIENIAPSRVLNLTGKLNFLESSYIIKCSKIVISGDTGFLHVADLFGKKTIALIGPSAFGYPYRDKVKVVETDLPCKPCTKDGSNGCNQKEYQKCMKEIKPKAVMEILEKL